MRRDRVWDLPLCRGSRRFTTPVVLRFGELHPMSVQPASHFGGVLPGWPMPPTSDIRVASPAPVLDEHRAFARPLVGKSRQDQFYRLSVTSDDAADPDAFHRQGPFRIDGEIPTRAFTLAGHRLGVSAHRAASDLLSHPRARWLSPTQAWIRVCVLLPTRSPVPRETCFALSSPFAPISWGTKDSTPWTRPPFTTPPTFRSTRPGDRWERFYGADKYRLPTSATSNTTYEHDPRAMVPAA